MKVEQTISCPRIAHLISLGLDDEERILDLMEQLEKIYLPTRIRRSDLEERSRLIDMRINPVIDELYDLADGITDTRDGCAQRQKCRRCLITSSLT